MRLDQFLDFDELDRVGSPIDHGVLGACRAGVALANANLGHDLRAVGIDNVHGLVHERNHYVFEFMHVYRDRIIRRNGPLGGPKDTVVDLSFTDCKVASFAFAS